MIARGIKIATAAVLFINPEIKDTVIKKIKKANHFLFPAFLYKKSAKTSKNPVLTREWLIIKIAPIVITALLLKPLIASSIEIISNKRSRPTAPMQQLPLPRLQKQRPGP